MAGEQAPPVKTRPPPRKAQLARREEITPRFLRLTFSGDALRGFGPAKPTAHIKFLFGNLPDGWKPGDPGPRPVARTYTPRRFDPAAATLEVEVLRHGEGIASVWAESARPGDSLLIAGPGGGFDVAPDLKEAALFADETALPAAGMLLDALPAGCRVSLFAEIEDAAEERQLSTRRDVATHWLHRGKTRAPHSARLEQALADLSPAEECFIWIACEAAAMRRMRTGLLGRGHDRRRLVTRGYWKLGQADYPDGDYGE